MGSIWRGIRWIGMSVLLASCSHAPPASAPLAPQTPALEQLYQQGRVAFREGRYEEAATQFNRVVATDPEHVKARLNWAAALSYANKPTEAIVQCQNVLARDPTSAEAYYQWGAVLVRAGKHQEAMEKFDQAIALKPLNELLRDEPTLQQSLEAYLKRQRRQALDPEVIRPKSDASRGDGARRPDTPIPR